MRRLAAALWLLAAACSVPLEGAPCNTDANCPGTQRCEGAGAQPGRCVACESDPACTTDGFACVDGSVRECRTNAGTCHYALYTSCGALTCSGGNCMCPSNSGSVFAADAVQGSAVGSAFAPNGVLNPPQCRYRSLRDALAAAAAYAVGPPARTATVQAVGRPSGGTMVFSGEQFPLTVKPGVTLTTDDAPPAAGGYVVDLDNATPVAAAIQVQEDAALSGFVVRPSATGGASVGVALACGTAGTLPVQISSTTVNGKGTLASAVVARGIELTGPCSADLTDLRVESVSGAGVYLASIGTAAGSPALSLLRTTVTGAGDTGIQVRLDATSGRPALSLVSSEVTANAGAQTYGGAARRAGGMLFYGAPPSNLTFQSNRIHGNQGDQVVVYSSASWDLSSGTVCGPTSNVFACYDGTWVGLGLASNGAVSAGFNSWASDPPVGGTDYFAGAGTVTIGTSCNPVPPTSCPLPPP